MRKTLVAAIVVAAGLSGPVLANGLMGGDSPPTRIPVPAHNYRAVVEDGGGTRIEVEQASFAGEVFLYGKYGEGQVTVAFDKLSEVRFQPSGTEGEIIAFATLKDGQKVRFTVEDDVLCYGKTSFGLYQIEARHIRRIEFP